MLVYVSAWIKHHHPDVFLAAMLNSQPMGFYQPAQLVRDAREHGVEVRAADVMLSTWDCTLEAGAVRLGLRQIAGLRREEVDKLIAARTAGARSLPQLAASLPSPRRSLELLAEADALRSLGMDRRAGLWAVKGLAPEAKAQIDAPLLALMGPPAEGRVQLPTMPLPAHVVEDYRTTSLSLKAHPVAFFRLLLNEMGAVTAARLKTAKDGARLCVGGLVLVRQRPGTAKGVVFITLEDETGSANAVVWKDAFAANRRTVMGSRFLVVHGRLQRAGEVIHVVAERFTDLTGRLGELKAEQPAPLDARPAPSTRLVRSRDFH
jgi:error-prone DNA polymerase